MKKISSLFIILIVVCGNGLSAAGHKNTLTVMRLKGRVKSVREECFKAVVISVRFKGHKGKSGGKGRE
jgi:hypothetical protein